MSYGKEKKNYIIYIQHSIKNFKNIENQIRILILMQNYITLNVIKEKKL